VYSDILDTKKNCKCENQNHKWFLISKTEIPDIPIDFPKKYIVVAKY